MNEQLEWIRSSFCSSHSCAEVARLPDGQIGFRRSDKPDEIVIFTPEEWEPFLMGVQAGEFPAPA